MDLPSAATLEFDHPPAPLDARRARLQKNFWWIFAIVGAGNFLGPLSGSITNVALPAIAKGFAVDVQSAKWVVLSYLMVSTILLPIAGKLGQKYGEGRIYTTGFAIYFVGSVACALSQYGSLTTLVLARMVQATGSALVFSVGGALVAHYVPPNRRGLAYGLVGSIVGIALITGPVLGGILSDKAGWPWIFWCVAPVTLIGLIACLVLLPREQGRAVNIPALSSVAWLLLVDLAVVLIGEAFSKGLWLNYFWLTGSIAALALAGFLLSERRGPPLFAYELFRIQVFRMAASAGVLLNLTIFALILFLPFYLEDYQGIPLMRVGMILAISPLASILVGPGSGHLADRIGYRIPILGGITLALLGYLLMALAVSTERLWLVSVSLGVMGMGGALFAGPNFAALMGSVPPEQRPLASSFGSLTRNVGFLAGTSLAAMFFGLLLWHYGGKALMAASRTEQLSAAVSPGAFRYAFTGVLLGCAGLLLLAALISLSFPNRPTQHL